MLAAQHHHHDIFVGRAPSHNIHHRLGVAIGHGQGIVERAEQLLAAHSIGRTYDERRTRIVRHVPDATAIVEREHGHQIATEPLPTALQWQNTGRAGL